MAKGRSGGRSGRSKGGAAHRSHATRRAAVGGVGHRTHTRGLFSRRNHNRTNHTTTRAGGMLRVSGGYGRNDPNTLIILGSIFSLIAIGELIACLVLGLLVATCVKKPKENNCPDYDAVMIPLGSSGGVFLLVGVLFIFIAILKIIQKKKLAAAAAVGETGFANVSVMQLETGEATTGMQPYPMMISNPVDYGNNYYGQPVYSQNPMMMNYQYPPTNANSVIPPNQQQPFYFNNMQTNVVGNSNMDPQFVTYQHYNNHSGMQEMMNNHGQLNSNTSNISNIPNQQVNAAVHYSTNYSNPTSDNDQTTIYIPSPQAPPQQEVQQINMDEKCK